MTCREIVRRVEACWEEHGSGGQAATAPTGAYCRARARLDSATLELIWGEFCWSLKRNILQEECGLVRRPVQIADGACFDLPDTLDNQAYWPQP